MGVLGGNAKVEGVQGVWDELTNNVCLYSFFHVNPVLISALMQVNRMCDNLTTQVRTIARVTTAVAAGDLTQKVDIPVQGEMAKLKDTVNSMVEQLSVFAAEVTRVALEGLPRRFRRYLKRF
jgi:osomolarity two-component system sensor histidine kinase NIK1